MPSIDALTIAKDPGVSLVNERGNATDFSLYSRTIDDVLGAPYWSVFKIAILEPGRP